MRGDDDVNVRREAARLLAAGAFGDDDVFRNDHTARRTFQKVAALASALRDKSIDEPGLVGQLEKALLKTGVRHERLLEAPLDRCLERHPSAAVRAAAATTAGALGCCECLRRLWLVQPDQTATRPEIVTVRVAAVNALARNGSSTTIRELAAADDLAEVRRAAYEWLARLDDAEGLAREGPRRRRPCTLRAAAACLLADVLLRRAANDAPTWQWRADAFPRPPPPAFEHAPRRLDAAAADGFENAASALIQAAQRDAEENVRGAALESLGRLRCVPGVAVGLEDASEASRLRAVELLEELAGDEAAAALERALDDPSTEVRRRATDARRPPRGPAGRVVQSGRARRRSSCAGDDGDSVRRAETAASPGRDEPGGSLYAPCARRRPSIGGLAAQAKEGDADAAAALDGLPLRQLLASRLGDADR